MIVKILKNLKQKLSKMPPRTRARWLGTFTPGILTVIYGFVMINWMVAIAPVLNGKETMDRVMTASQLTGYVMTMWLGLSVAFLIWVSVKAFGNRKERLEIEERYQ